MVSPRAPSSPSATGASHRLRRRWRRGHRCPSQVRATTEAWRLGREAPSCQGPSRPGVHRSSGTDTRTSRRLGASVVPSPQSTTRRGHPSGESATSPRRSRRGVVPTAIRSAPQLVSRVFATNVVEPLGPPLPRTVRLIRRELNGSEFSLRPCPGAFAPQQDRLLSTARSDRRHVLRKIEHGTVAKIEELSPVLSCKAIATLSPIQQRSTTDVQSPVGPKTKVPPVHGYAVGSWPLPEQGLPVEKLPCPCRVFERLRRAARPEVDTLRLPLQVGDVEVRAGENWKPISARGGQGRTRPGEAGRLRGQQFSRQVVAEIPLDEQIPIVPMGQPAVVRQQCVAVDVLEHQLRQRLTCGVEPQKVSGGVEPVDLTTADQRPVPGLDDSVLCDAASIASALVHEPGSTVCSDQEFAIEPLETRPRCISQRQQLNRPSLVARHKPDLVLGSLIDRRPAARKSRHQKPNPLALPVHAHGVWGETMSVPRCRLGRGHPRIWRPSAPVRVPTGPATG